MELPAHWKYWEDRVGLESLGTLSMGAACAALVAAVPTMHHALRTIRRAGELLGARGLFDPQRPEYEPSLHLRDEELEGWAVPVPLVTLALEGGTTQTVVLMGAGPSQVVSPTDILPAGPEMRAGTLTVHEGPRYFSHHADARGVIVRSEQSAIDPLGPWHANEPFRVDPRARPPGPRPIELLLREDVVAGTSPERLADRIVDLSASHASLVPARALVPAKCPMFLLGALQVGVAHLRRALFADRLPPEAGFAVIDAYDGSALAYGATRHEAIARWKDELFRKKPRPPGGPTKDPRPDAPDEKPGILEDEQGRRIGYTTGTLRLSVGGGGAPPVWPAAIPANVPGLLVPVPALPTEIPAALREAGFSRWKRVLGAHGIVQHALLREEEDGFVLVGEGIVDIVSPATMHAEMDASDAREAELSGGRYDTDQYARSIMLYSCFDNGHQRPSPCAWARGAFGDALDAAALDGDEIAWSVTRVRGMP